MGMAWLCASSLGCTITYSRFEAPTPYPLAAPSITLTVQEALKVVSLPTVTPTAHPQQWSIAISPQPSPTPHYYMVQSNDTLMDIAILHDIPLDDLLLANPDVNANALQIGQPLLIVKNRSDLLLAPLPVLSLPIPQCYPTPTNQLLCVGTILNPLPTAVERVMVEVQFFDREQVLLHQQQVEPALSVIYPNQHVPYHFTLSQITLEQIGGIGTLLVGGAETDTATARFVALQTQDLTYTLANDQVMVAFDVVNPTTQTANGVRVLVALYDEDQVIAYRVFEKAGSFVPSAVAHFSETLHVLTRPSGTHPPTLYLEAPLQQDALPTPAP